MSYTSIFSMFPFHFVRSLCVQISTMGQFFCRSNASTEEKEEEKEKEKEEEEEECLEIFLALPNEIWMLIIERFWHEAQYVRLRGTCTRFKALCDLDSVKRVLIKKLNHTFSLDVDVQGRMMRCVFGMVYRYTHLLQIYAIHVSDVERGLLMERYYVRCRDDVLEITERPNKHNRHNHHTPTYFQKYIQDRWGVKNIAFKYNEDGFEDTFVIKDLYFKNMDIKRMHIRLGMW